MRLLCFAELGQGSPLAGEGTASPYRMAARSGSAAVQQLGPEYAAVLAACAACIWVQPSYLHKLVIRAETTMVNLEAEVGVE